MKYWLECILLCLGLLLPLCSKSSTPIEKFSTNREVFIKELETYMKRSNNKILIKAYDDFEAYFNSGAYSVAETETIIEVSNLMLERKVKANPVFKDYLTALLFVKEKNNAPHLFNEWHKVLSQLLTTDYKKRTKQFKNYVDFSTTLFSNGALKTGHRSNAWLAENAVFHLGNSDGKLTVVFEQLDLVAIRKTSRFEILKTSGTYFPDDQKWSGEGGEITWADADRSEVYCSLENYNLKFSGNLIDIDAVVLHHQKLFPNQPIAGSFSTKLLSSKKQAPGYPKFTAFDKKIVFKNIGKRVLLKAGLKISGENYYGVGDEKSPAVFEVFDNVGQLSARSVSDQFKIIPTEYVSGKSCATTLFIGQDSLYHPAIDWRYNFEDFQIQLKKGNLPNNEAPFYSSYQRMFVHTDKVSWIVGAESILINEKNKKIGNGSKTVKLESLHFFDSQLYRKLQNGADRNPIAILKMMSEKKKTTEIPAVDYAKALNPRYDVSQIKSLLYTMVGEGLINYHAQSETITVYEKLLHFGAAAQDQTDFDLIRYYSKSDATNANLRLDNHHLIVNDIDILEFSDRQKVAAKPFKGQVTIEEDRNTSFDGKLFAGYTNFIGKDFHFKYQKNEIHLDSVRYFDLFTTDGTKDQSDKAKAHSIASRIEHLSGILLIDAPKNKSGKQDIPTFPSFHSKGPAYLFYDTQDTIETYPRDSFYFELDEFHLNALDDLTPDQIEFKGHLESAGILPNIEETVTLQEDGSLGFQTTSPEEGYAAYGGKGGLKGDVELNNNGLAAIGEISYGSATIQSDDIVLKPNQLLSTAQNFDLEESREVGKELPEVHGEAVKIDWKPYQDSMFIVSQESDFQLFKNRKYQLRDMLILTPDGLRGRGVFEWEKGKLEAQLYTFGANSVISDTTDLTIKAPGMDHLALDTKNVYTELDFDNNIGTVRANSDSVYTELPYNTYITSLNEFDWDMKNETVTFRADEDGNGSFKSTNKEHDGLTFWGKEAFYDLKTYDLKLGGVTRIETADAYVLPDSGAVEIQKMGKMKTLTNARIIADTANQYHVIKNAKVNIQGRLDYRATGFYEYNIGDKQQELELIEIIGQPVGKGKRKNRKCLTTAVGKTSIGTPFYMDHKTQFSGEIALNAAEANLKFDGFAKIDASSFPNSEWFSIQSPGDKNDLKLSYTSPKNKKGERLYTGLIIEPNRGEIYPAVMNTKKTANSHVLFESAGLFDFDKENDQFLFGDSIKIVSQVKNGNLLTLDNKNETIQVEGAFNFFDETDAIISKIAGETSFKLQDSDQPIRIKSIAGFDFHLPEKLLKIIAADLRANGYSARNIDFMSDRKFYHQALSEFIPPGKDLANTRAKMLSLGLEFPKKYNNYQFLLTDFSFKWDEASNSLISEKKNIGIAILNGQPVNKMIEGAIKFRVLPNGSKRIRLLLKIPGSETRYFFEYQEGSLMTISDNEDYNTAVENLKKKERFPKTAKGTELEIVLGGGF